jgi:hypothetical protein
MYISAGTSMQIDVPPAGRVSEDAVRSTLDVHTKVTQQSVFFFMGL